MYKHVKIFEHCGRICVVVAIECLERMDILSVQNAESVKFLNLKLIKLN